MKINRHGHIAYSHERDAVRINRALLYSVAYAYRDEASAEAGEGMGATGFFIAHRFPQGTALYLVTNRHVIEDGFLTFRLRTNDDKVETLATNESEWKFHYDPSIDIAVYNLKYDAPHLFLMTDGFIRPSSIDPFEIWIGDGAVMVGRHLNHEGRETNSPTARFGYIAQFPESEIADERGRSYKAWLVQIPSLPGYSGSPVFLKQDAADKAAHSRKHSFGMDERIHLLGINCGHLPYNAPTVTPSGSRNQHLEAEIGSGIAVVTPAWHILEAIGLPRD